MHFTLTSDREVSVDGIGILRPNEPRRLSAEEVAKFGVLNSVGLIAANFPHFVQLVAVTDDEEDGE